jgi:hypothetical protein
LVGERRPWGHRVTTVFPRQGHYALDEKAVSKFPPADCTIDRIGDLVTIDFQALTEGGSMQAGAAFREKLWRKLELAPGGSPSAPPGG